MYNKTFYKSRVKQLIDDPSRLNNILDNLVNWRPLLRLVFKNYYWQIRYKKLEEIKVQFLRRLLNCDDEHKFKTTIIGFEYFILNYLEKLKDTKYLIKYCQLPNLWKENHKFCINFNKCINYFVNELDRIDLIINVFKNSKNIYVSHYYCFSIQKSNIKNRELFLHILKDRTNYPCYGFHINKYIIENFTEDEFDELFKNYNNVIYFEINSIEYLINNFSKKFTDNLVKNDKLHFDRRYITNANMEIIEKYYPHILDIFYDDRFDNHLPGFENITSRNIIKFCSLKYRKDGSRSSTINNNIIPYLKKYMLNDYFQNNIFIKNFDFIQTLINEIDNEDIKNLFKSWYSIKGSIYKDRILHEFYIINNTEMIEFINNK